MDLQRSGLAKNSSGQVPAEGWIFLPLDLWGSQFLLSSVSSFSCVAQWTSFQEARQTVIELMNEAEKKLTQFSTAKAATSQEAEERLRSHRVGGVPPAWICSCCEL